MARALAVLVVALLVPASASAHVGHVILRAERYLKLDVSGRSARMVVSLTLGPDEGERVLSAADVDTDGQVDATEMDAYLSQWGAGLREELPIELDDEPLEVRWTDGYLEPTGRVRRTALTVEMVARFELEGGEQTVRVTDRMVRREVFERTDVAFDVRDGAELLGSGVEGEAATPTPDLAYGSTFREGDPVPLIARLRTPAPPAAAPPYMTWGLAGAGAVLVAIVGALVVRARRSRR